MESSITEILLVPWWKMVVYILVLAFSIVAVRVTFQLDLNAYLITRRKNKLKNEQLKRSRQCRHAWTLFPDSHFSSCANCHGWITTAILQAARNIADVRPIILAERPGVTIEHQGELVIVDDYIGMRS